jgi:predicted nucleic acid-binding protein
VKLFVDTWGWVALADWKDPGHEGATQFFRKARRSSGVVTSNFVLDETFTLFFARRPFEEASRFASGLLASPFITREEITTSRFRKAFDLRLAFRDKPDISFTDLTSMAIMQELKIMDVLTGDRHFLQAGFGFRILP